MNRPARIAVAVGLPGIAMILALSWPQFVLQSIILPMATVLWLVLRIFVLSIDQHVYWWALIALGFFGAIAVLLQGTASHEVIRVFSLSTTWDPSHRWHDSIEANLHAPPPRDSFRRDLAWLLSSLYASPRPGGAKYQVRELLQGREISLPDGIHDFLFASTRPPDPAPPFLKNPRASLQAAAATFLSAARGRRSLHRRRADYVRRADEVLAFMEKELEMTQVQWETPDELDTDG